MGLVTVIPASEGRSQEAPCSQAEVTCTDGVGLSLGDLGDILAIASELGVATPERILAGKLIHPGDRLLVAVSQDTAESGVVRVYRRIVYICREDWKDCASRSRPEGLVVRGRWRSSAGSVHEDLWWRIRDGRWSATIQLGDGVEYHEAVRIMRAIRRRRVQVESTEGLIAVSRINADRVILIELRKPLPHEEPPEEPIYEVWESTHRYGGNTLDVTVSKTGVHLISGSVWIS